MRTKIRTAVVGLGNMGRHHLRHLSTLDCVQLIAVCDANADAVTSFSSTYSCLGYTDFQTMIAEQSLDFVCIITPTPYHFELAKMALDANIHVFVEKPITSTVPQADQLIALATERQLILSVGHIERFNPSVLAVQQLISTGVLGSVIGIESYRVSPMPTQIRDDDVIMDLGVHDIELCNAFIGAIPSTVSATRLSQQLTDRCDMAQILMTYPTAFASIQISWVSPIRRRGFRLICTNGYLEANTMAHTATYTVGEDPTPLHLKVEKSDALLSELSDVVFAIINATTPKVTGHDARETLAIIHSLY